MAEKEHIMLSEKEVIPTDNLIFSIIGDRKKLWQTLMAYMVENFKDSVGEWNYYNDGKRWLFKSVYKKKTVFWIGILEDTFRVSVWFPNKAEPLIENSDLPMAIKDEFKNAKRYGSTRAVSIIMRNMVDVDNVLILIAIRVKIK